MKYAKRTLLAVAYNGTDISEQLHEFLLNWTFTDNLTGAIDDLSLTLEDRNALWLTSWFPSKGSTLVPTLKRFHWNAYPEVTKLGIFEIDDLSGKDSVITINALATSEKSSLRKEKKCKAWEKTYLKTVIGEIAKKHGMKLIWEASDNPKKDRYEQDNQTDLAFIHELCNEEGLCLKINSNSIVVLDEKDYEDKPAVTHINRIPKDEDLIKIIDRSFSSSLTNVYRNCRVQHHDSKKKKKISATFTPGKAPKVGRTLVIKQEVKSQAEALKLARKKLRETNKEATKFTFKVHSQMHIDAGMTFDLKMFGQFDGKYIVTKVVYGPSDITLHLRKCLEGY